MILTTTTLALALVSPQTSEAAPVSAQPAPAGELVTAILEPTAQLGWQIDVGYINASPDEEGGEDLSGFNVNLRRRFGNLDGAARTSFEVGISSLSSSQDVGDQWQPQSLDVRAFEFRAGIDASFTLPDGGGAVRPYIGAGLSYIDATLSTSGVWGEGEASSSDVGFYAKLGLRVLFKPDEPQSPFFDVGVRKTGGHDDDFDGSLDYTAVVASVGMSW